MPRGDASRALDALSECLSIADGIETSDKLGVSVDFWIKHENIKACWDTAGLTKDESDATAELLHHELERLRGRIHRR